MLYWNDDNHERGYIMSKANEQQQEWLDLIESGLTPTQAAAGAGYKNPAKDANRMAKLPWAQQPLTAIRNTKKAEMKMTREKVQRGILDAIELAKIGGVNGPDPSSMIRGYAEINRMCGYHAPEKREVILSSAQKRIQGNFEDMSDEKLLELIGEDALEGEYRVLDEDDA